MDYLERLEEKPRDPILGLSAIYLADKNPNKLNLGVGAYKTEEGQVALFQSVHEAERFLLDEKRNKGYAPIDGDKGFRDEVLSLIFGEFDSNTHYCAHTTGCTAALRVSGEVLREMGLTTIYLPDLTWPNHSLLYKSAGLKTELYTYYDTEKNELKLPEIFETLKNAPKNSAVLFQVSCHNPVGRDPTKEEWGQIMDLIKEKELFLILDSAYQGFGSGLQEDIFPVLLANKKLEQFFLCYSFAKNFGLYGERTGAFIAVDHTQKSLVKLTSNAKHYIRGCYSCPPIHGARIVKTILETNELREIWENELNEMRLRLKTLRSLFVQALKEADIKRNYSYIEEDMGLFSLMGLSKEQVVKLRENQGIYIVENGRLNIAALTTKNMAYVAQGIKQVL